MVSVALAVALIQARVLGEFTHVVRRVDCQVTLRREYAGERPDNPRTVDYVFLFLDRENSAARRRRLLYVESDEDGGTSLDRGFVTSERGSRWPDFSASLQFHGGTATLASDPQTLRRIVYRSVQTPPDVSWQVFGEGSCEIFPRARSVRP